MAPRDTYGYSSSSGTSRSSSSSSAALARELGALSINSKKASSYEPKYTSRSAQRDPEPRYSSKPTSKYDSTLITPDTSRSRNSKATHGPPIIRDERKQLKDERRSKTSDSRYYENSFLDNGAKYSTSSTRNDSRFYPDSSYYRERR